MSDKKDILDFFTDAHIVQDSDGKFTIRVDDIVLEGYFKDLTVSGYDEYLDGIRSMTMQYVSLLKKISTSLNDILAEEQQVTRERVIARLKHASPYTGKSALIRNNH